MDLRVFYAAYFFPGSTGIQRMRAFEQCGLTCIPFDMAPYVRGGPRLLRSVWHRLSWGPPVAALNRALLKAAAEETFDWIWIDKGIWVYPQTLKRLRERTAARLIHFTPDVALGTRRHRTRHFLRSIPRYDAMVTTKSFEQDAYRAAGARRVEFVLQGFDPDIFQPHPLTADETARFAADVTFIGRCEPHYVNCVRAAREVTDKVAVWGQWAGQAAREPWLRPIVRGEGVYEADYAKALGGAKITLGLLSKIAGDVSTTRTFEIPASGGFMLAERTDEHLGLFEEDREAAFFSGEDELRDKIRYYLGRPQERERIAAAGRQRCLQSGYSYRERFQRLFADLADLKSATLPTH